VISSSSYGDKQSFRNKLEMTINSLQFLKKYNSLKKMHQGKTNPPALDYKAAIKHFPIEVLLDYRGRTSNSRIVAYKIRCSQEWKKRGRESSTPYNLQRRFF